MAAGVMASQVASGIGMIVGAWMFKSLFLEGEEGLMPRCPTCNGAKRVPCICQRWSDGDQGCATCARTGMRPCTTCGGSGTGRPLPVKLRLSDTHKKFPLQYLESSVKITVINKDANNQ
ncbi:hypothetical protein KI387_031820, partial [Taxus chinensis]